MNTLYLSCFSFTASLLVSSAGQRDQDFIITDTQQIPNLNANERETLGRLISSLGEKDVEITIIEAQKPQPQRNLNPRQQYGFPVERKQLVTNNPQIDVVEIYTNESPNRKYQNSGPPSRHRPRPPGPEPYRPIQRRERYPPPRPPRPPPHSPPEKYHSPPTFEEDDHPREYAREYHHRRKHRKQQKHRNREEIRRRPPPQPIFDEDDPRREYDDYDRHHHQKHFDRTTKYPREIIFPDITTPGGNRDKSPNQHNINLSDSTKTLLYESDSAEDSDEDYDNDESEDYNVAGYINDFPVILLKKNEIRK